MRREKRWLNGREAAEYLGIDYTTLWRKRNQGEIPFGIRLGKPSYDRVVLERLNAPVDVDKYVRAQQRAQDRKAKADKLTKTT